MLNAILTKEEYAKLPEVVREHYTQRDDDGTSFILDVKEVEGYALDEVKGLKSALMKERTGREALDKQLKDLKDGYGDQDPAKVREALAKLETLKNATPEEKVRERIESAVKEIKAKAEADLSKVTEQANQYKSQIQQQLVDGNISKALANQKLVEGGAELLHPHIQKFVKIEEQEGQFVTRVVDEAGNVRVSMKQGSTDPMSVEELVGSMAEDKRYAPIFAGNGKSGTPTPQRPGSGSPAQRQSGDISQLSPEKRLEQLRGG